MGAASTDLPDEHIVAEQNHLRTKAQKAEDAALEAMACAARLRKQLDFLEGREGRILRSELECLELLEWSGVWLPEPETESPASPSSFSDVLGAFDWPSLDAVDGRSS